MKKILIVSGSLQVGGLENVAMNFSRYSDKNKYHIDYLVYGKEEGTYEAEAKSIGCKVIHITSPGTNYLKFYIELKKAILNNGPYDIVHSHVFFNTGLVLKAAKSCGVKKCVAHAHSGMREGDDSLKKRLIYHFLRKLIIKNADVKCACSEASGYYVYGKKAFSEKGIVIPNAVNLVKYSYNEHNRYEIRRQLGISGKAFVVGHIGHMLPVKNQLFLLECFGEYLKEYDSNAILLIIGDGPLRGKIENQIKENRMDGNVILTGVREDVYKIVSAMDTFALSSLHEGLPVTLVETMANGLSFIIEKSVVAKEMAMFQNCISVEGYDKIKWCKAIDEARQTGRFSSEKCRDELVNYDINHFKELIDDLYN